MIFNSQIWRRLSKMRCDIQTHEKRHFHPQFQITNKRPACRSFHIPRLILQNSMHPYSEVQLPGPIWKPSCTSANAGFSSYCLLIPNLLGHHTIGCISNSSFCASSDGVTMTTPWVIPLEPSSYLHDDPKAGTEHDWKRIWKNWSGSCTWRSGGDKSNTCDAQWPRLRCWESGTRGMKGQTPLSIAQLRTSLSRSMQLQRPSHIWQVYPTEHSQWRVITFAEAWRYPTCSKFQLQDIFQSLSPNLPPRPLRVWPRRPDPRRCRLIAIQFAVHSPETRSDSVPNIRASLAPSSNRPRSSIRIAHLRVAPWWALISTMSPLIRLPP